MAITTEFIKKLEVSSASGLIRMNGRFYAVADDELSLISFTEEPLTGIESLKLFEGQLPEDPVARKKIKPDLEALTLISSLGAMLGLPSGSKENRSKGALIRFNSDAVPLVMSVDFSRLFAELRTRIADLNLEGIVEFGNSILIFQRGNAKAASNAVIKLEADIFVTELQTGIVTPKSLKTISNCRLGLLHGVPLSFTDAAVWETTTGKKLTFIAAAEDTLTTYDDGEFRGAIFGVLNEDFEVLYSEELLCSQKPEGLWVENSNFFFVTDADDPNLKSEFYSFKPPL